MSSELPALAVTSDGPTTIRRIMDTVNMILRGRMNNVSTLTLTANTTTTVVTDNRFESQMTPLLMATTANAAGAVATTYVSARTQGAFTLTHANVATTDRSFLYARFG